MTGSPRQLGSNLSSPDSESSVLSCVSTSAAAVARAMQGSSSSSPECPSPQYLRNAGGVIVRSSARPTMTKVRSIAFDIGWPLYCSAVVDPHPPSGVEHYDPFIAAHKAGRSIKSVMSLGFGFASCPKNPPPRAVMSLFSEPERHSRLYASARFMGRDEGIIVDEPPVSVRCTLWRPFEDDVLRRVEREKKWKRKIYRRPS